MRLLTVAVRMVLTAVSRFLKLRNGLFEPVLPVVWLLLHTAGTGEEVLEWEHGGRGAAVLCLCAPCAGSAGIVLQLLRRSGSCGRPIARTGSCPQERVRLPRPDRRGAESAPLGPQRRGLGLELCRDMQGGLSPDLLATLHLFLFSGEKVRVLCDAGCFSAVANSG